MKTTIRLLATSLLILAAAWPVRGTVPAGTGKPPAAVNSNLVFKENGGTKSLKAAFAGRFAIGAAIPGAELKDNERQLLFKHFSNITPENCMKPSPLHPAENRFDFAKADALVNMAKAKGLTVNGHTLIWHNQCPDWFFNDGGRQASRELVLKRMRSHITAVARHFAGKVASWDVVNEAIDDDKEYLRKTNWLKSIGEDFIA